MAVLKTLGLRCMIKVSTPGVAKAGRVLAKQGGKATDILVIVQGECRLVTTAPPVAPSTAPAPGSNSLGSPDRGAMDSAGRPRTAITLKSGFVAALELRQLAVLGAQAMIGDMAALLEEGTHPASVIASTSVKYLTIPLDKFLAELALRPELLSTLRSSAKDRHDWIRKRTSAELDLPPNEGEGEGDGDDGEGEVDGTNQDEAYNGMIEKSPFAGWTEVGTGWVRGGYGVGRIG